MSLFSYPRRNNKQKGVFVAATIRRTLLGNYYGYLGNKRVKSFNRNKLGAEQWAKSWKELIIL